MIQTDDTGEIDSIRTNIQTANQQLLELLGTVKGSLNHIGQEFDSMYSKLKSVVSATFYFVNNFINIIHQNLINVQDPN